MVAAWSKAYSFHCLNAEIISSGPGWCWHDHSFLFALSCVSTDLAMTCSPYPTSPTDCLKESYFQALILKWDKPKGLIHKMLINVNMKNSSSGDIK
jgi:hypothetical protein